MIFVSKYLYILSDMYFTKILYLQMRKQETILLDHSSEDSC